MDKQIPDVIAKVISQKGNCEAGHKVGDTFIIGQQTPPNLCSWAFQSLFPLLKYWNLVGYSLGRLIKTRPLSLAPMQIILWYLNYGKVKQNKAPVFQGEVDSP